MKNSTLVLTIIMCLILLFNLLLFYKISELADNISYLQQENHQLKAVVNSLPGRLNNFSNQIKELNSWHTPIRVKPTNLQEDKIRLTANWQIKDYSPDAEIKFHYQLNDEQFKQIKVDSNQQGFFTVELPLEVELAPNWQIKHVNSQQPHRIIEKIGKSKDNQLKYYVSLNSEGQIRSSKIKHYNLNNLGRKLYGPLAVTINSRDNNYNISLNSPQPTNQTVTQVRLKIYNHRELISTVSLEQTNSPNRRDKMYHTSYQLKNKISRLVLEVKYNSGRKFTKEIYNKLY